MTRGLSWLDANTRWEAEEDASHKGLHATLPTPKVMLRRLEGGHLCRPVTRWACESLPVDDLRGSRRVGEGLRGEGWGILES